MSQQLKEIVGQEIAKKICSGWLVGVGTGSTVDAAIKCIATRIFKEKLDVKFVTTSFESAALLHAQGLLVLDSSSQLNIDFGFDGVDAINNDLAAIKGKGAAILREKILAVKCKQYVYILDKTKLVINLASCPIPVEVIPEALSYVCKKLKDIGAEKVTVRPAGGKHGNVVTEYGNMIVDVQFAQIEKGLEFRLKGITGVVESGLFTDYAQEALIAYPDHVETIRRTR